MSNIVTRKFINPDIAWHQFDDTGKKIVIDYKEISSAIDHWKNILVEKANFRRGHKLAIGANLCDLRYMSLIFAGVELGAKLVIIDKPLTPEKISDVRCRIHAPFDLMVVNDNDVSPELQAVVDTYATKTLTFDLWYDSAWRSPTGKPAGASWAKPDCDILICTSSGTTGTPSPISYTHEFFAALIDRQEKALDFRSEDRCLHLSNFHHGGSSANFFWPSMKFCKYHYFDYGLTVERLPEIINLVYNEKINKVMFPNVLVLEEFIKRSPRYEVPLDVHLLGSNRKSWIPMMAAANIRSITAHWGFSEMEGPILLNVMRSDSPDDFDAANFGKLLDDFYSAEIVEQGFRVSNHLRGSWTSKDRLTRDKYGNYIFHGRTNGVRLNGNLYNFEIFSNMAEKYFDNKAYLVPDSEFDRIYLLCDISLEHRDDFTTSYKSLQQSLHKLDPELTISRTAFQDLYRFYDQVKFSHARAKSFFREDIT